MSRAKAGVVKKMLRPCHGIFTYGWRTMIQGSMVNITARLRARKW